MAEGSVRVVSEVGNHYHNVAGGDFSDLSVEPMDAAAVDATAMPRKNRIK
jgi:hypothetical protein